MQKVSRCPWCALLISVIMRDVKPPSGHGDGFRSHYSYFDLHMNYIYMCSRNLFQYKSSPADWMTFRRTVGPWSKKNKYLLLWFKHAMDHFERSGPGLKQFQSSVTLTTDKLNNWDKQRRIVFDTKNPSNPAVNLRVFPRILKNTDHWYLVLLCVREKNQTLNTQFNLHRFEDVSVIMTALRDMMRVVKQEFGRDWADNGCMSFKFENCLRAAHPLFPSSWNSLLCSST